MVNLISYKVNSMEQEWAVLWIMAIPLIIIFICGTVAFVWANRYISYKDRKKMGSWEYRKLHFNSIRCNSPISAIFIFLILLGVIAVLIMQVVNSFKILL